MRSQRDFLISHLHRGLHRGQRSMTAQKGRTYDRTAPSGETSEKALASGAVPHMTIRGSLRPSRSSAAGRSYSPGTPGRTGTRRPSSSQSARGTGPAAGHRRFGDAPQARVERGPPSQGMPPLVAVAMNWKRGPFSDDTRRRSCPRPGAIPAKRLSSCPSLSYRVQ